MVGPVLYLEMLLGGRRGRQYVFRWLYGGWLVLQLLFFYAAYWARFKAGRFGWMGGPPDASATGDFASGFVQLFVVQQLILLLLATPAFTAGAITDEKTRGTLQYMLTAHVTAAEIVIGKLLGRLAQVAILVLAGLPLLCFIGVFGGLNLPLLLAVLISAAAPMFAVGAASVLASVWCRQTRDAVIILYACGAVAWLVVAALTTWLPRALAGMSPGPSAALLGLLYKFTASLSPLEVLRPALETGDLAEVGRRLWRCVFAWGTVGLGCLGLATWRLRAAYLRQLENSGKRVNAGADMGGRGEVGDEPLRWKEQQVEGIAPLPSLRAIPRWLGVTGIGVATVLLSGLNLWACAPLVKAFTLADVIEALQRTDRTVAGNAFFVQGIVAMLIASLVVGIRASGAISGEKERQTWEALLLTPLHTRELVRGKLGGIFGASIPYLTAYAVPAILIAGLGGYQALLWTVLWLGVTALAMYYVGAAGMWCSGRSKSSWRSLLATLGFGYLGGFLIFALSSPITAMVAAIIYIFLEVADHVYGTAFTQAVGGFGGFYVAFLVASCVALAVIFWIAARNFFLKWAEQRISELERIRHWKDEPFHRPLPRRSRQPQL